MYKSLTGRGVHSRNLDLVAVRAAMGSTVLGDAYLRYVGLFWQAWCRETQTPWTDCRDATCSFLETTLPAIRQRRTMTGGRTHMLRSLGWPSGEAGDFVGMILCRHFFLVQPAAVGPLISHRVVPAD
jgi:hypothetical protein